MLDLLDPLLGRFTARKAVELAADQCGADLSTLAPSQIEAASVRLRPILRTLLGAAAAQQVLDAIARPFREENT